MDYIFTDIHPSYIYGTNFEVCAKLYYESFAVLANPFTGKFIVAREGTDSEVQRSGSSYKVFSIMVRPQCKIEVYAGANFLGHVKKYDKNVASTLDSNTNSYAEVKSWRCFCNTDLFAKRYTI